MTHPSSGGTITPLASDTSTFEIVDLTTTRLPYAISEAGTPGSGSFNIGMCVEDNTTGPLTIDNTDWSIGYAFVTNSTLAVTDAKAVKGARGH